ncbi:bifunctional methylenetetrahydrofolate dehydrogenase/methenyltetrahydrofolate cyclohydrolase FolD [Coriobacteriia bacterium Es71-Z0120]|uniref:bifunctional methylenetetrahydrofolate dehydrogenase/methenyltetrahydrofolate cyclohydrolase FolD n=1 Tax=Parvivirga hydrogeniphila TaxID=2939460 RepID=UPI002260C81A|nr:bifunctional methylenetetrahydrofolate dehydrogenase/methenyltetrahydrofolate cyclohydrolase FolD [Parvivirga hydrogeniphila]MCL4079205.1 bifunctional methylenetetrahydrofolate dehydrogenase/methenyltetrahydrofolate cyclohydrolase FolD [Parvivirga hydrogeniphila]
MAPVIIDGKKVAAHVKERAAERVAALKARGVEPGLAVILVGDDPASRAYVDMKERDCAQVGIRSIDVRLPADTPQAELEALVDGFNADPAVHGILVQLPLPDGLDAEAVIARIAPEKDVDGFHPVSIGRLVRGLPALHACTPAGVMELLRAYGIDPRGKRAVVVGRSVIVGKPMALLLLQADATVTVCHSKTADLRAVCREADILVAAIGRARMIDASYVKPGAVVIDVGINRTDAGLVGDVDFESVAPIASAITPVPGGVGPMTRAMLMENTVAASEEASR